MKTRTKKVKLWATLTPEQQKDLTALTKKLIKICLNSGMEIGRIEAYQQIADLCAANSN
jgi:hypothetical protein